MTYPFPGVVKRYQEHYYADGLNELVQGFNGLIVGACILIANFREPTVIRSSMIMTLALVMLGLALFQKRILTAIRERISYQRIGFVEPLTLAEAGMQRRRAIIIISLVLFEVLVIGGSLLIVFGVIRIPRPLPSLIHWVPGLYGLVLGAFAIQEALQLAGRRRGLITGPLLMALGIVISVAVPRLLIGIGLMLLSQGLVLALSGGFTLWRFVHSPLPAEPAGA